MFDIIESIKKIKASSKTENTSIDISFSRTEKHITSDNKYISLFSNIEFRTDKFTWSGEVETVHIPYKDELLGYFVGGSVKNPIGVYQRAPGPLLKTSKKNNHYGEIDIITSNNGKLVILEEKDGIFVEFPSNGKVAIGVFLKAISEMPYSQIMENIAYAPLELRNSFLTDINTKETKSRLTYNATDKREPSIEDCINEVYNATLLKQRRSSVDKGMKTFHYKRNRIKTYLNNLKFKSIDNIEAKLSIGHRSVGTQLVDDIRVPIFLENGNVDEFYIPSRTHLTDKHAREIRRHDINRIRVKSDRIVTIQDESSMYFRVLGYKLDEDIDNLKKGQIINEDVLKQLNDTNLLMLKVETPTGKKVVTRTDETITYLDFITILNYFLTASSTNISDSSEYAMSNRVIISFETRIANDVSRVYGDIVEALESAETINDILGKLKGYPSKDLTYYLTVAKNKEITQPDLTNLLAKETMEHKSSALMKSSTKEMQYIQEGQYGRIDSIHAPQSDKIGSVNQLTVFAKVQEETGQIVSPYEKVRDGRPTGEIEYLTAGKEKNKNIAEWNNPLDTEEIEVRLNSDITVVNRKQVDYRELSPFHNTSLAHAMLPFQEFCNAKRSLMATAYQLQSIPLLSPEQAFVSTRAETEVPCLIYTASNLLQEQKITPNDNDKLKIVKADWKSNSVIYRFSYGDNFFVKSLPCIVTDKNTIYMYRLVKSANDEYDLDDLVFVYYSADTHEIDTWELNDQGVMPFVKNTKAPGLALGKNLIVGFKTMGSSTIEDGVLINQRLVADNTLTSLQTHTYKYKLKQGEQFMHYNAVAGLHSWVSPGTPVISILKPNGHVKHVKAFIGGEVIYTNIDNDTALLYVMTYHTAEVGDKITGRYGNKSVIAKIVPEEMMPYDPKTGEALDVCMNPLGLPSRMNYGQLLEVILAAAMKLESTDKQKIAVVTPYFPDVKERVMEKANEHGLKPKRLYLPYYNKYTERPILTGVMYILKLEQIANLKASAVGYPTAVDPMFGQPTASDNSDKGQKIGEMETWAMGACGMYHVLDDFFTLYVDDSQLRSKYFAALNDGANGPWNELKEDIKLNRSPSRNSLVIQSVIRSYGLDLVPNGDFFSVLPLDLTLIDSIDTKNTLLLQGDELWSKVALNSPIVSPFWIEKMPTMNLILDVHSVQEIVNGKVSVGLSTLQCVETNALSDITKHNYISGIDAVVHMLMNSNIDDAITRISAVLEHLQTEHISDGVDVTPEKASNIMSNSYVRVKQTLDLLQTLKSMGYNLDIFVMDYYPVLPSVFRQSTMDSNNKPIIHTFNKSLISICNAVTANDIYSAIKDFIGYGKSKDDASLTSISNFFLGSNSDGHGRIRDSVFSKRIGFSGRSVIVPMQDITTSPFFVGVPWYLILTMYDRVLSLKLKRKSPEIANEMCKDFSYQTPGKIIELSQLEWTTLLTSMWEFNYEIISKYISSDKTTCLAFYDITRRYIKQFIEGDVTNTGLVKCNGEYVDPDSISIENNIDASVVGFGRQPTLHKKSIRYFFVKLVDGWAIQIHPLVCGGFNADFDGDSMWVAAVFGESKIEALQKMAIDKDLIYAKNDKFSLSMTQDICLGLYCMSTYKNNKRVYDANDSKLYNYTDLTRLRNDVEYGCLHYYDAVLYVHGNKKKYLTTVGRLLINSAVNGTFTDNKFTDRNGIAKAHNICVTDDMCELKYDTIISSAGQPDELEATKTSDILDQVYIDETHKETINTCQRLYELGLAASDIYGVSISIDDLDLDLNLDAKMEQVEKETNEAAFLYNLGLITKDELRNASQTTWSDMSEAAKSSVKSALKPDNNLYYMVYSGARGNIGQILQATGFVGTIQKTLTEDIERPIRRCYGNGLSSFDVFQTLPSTRIGVVSTQSGTKDAGYATRQASYMVMGNTITEEDCGIDNSVITVETDSSGTITPECSNQLLSMYSYALPYLDEDFKITSKTLTYIEKHKLKEVVALDSNESIIDLSKLVEAYLEVDYDSDQYTAFRYQDGVEIEVDESYLFTANVNPNAKDYYKYKGLLDNDRLTIHALRYITEHKLREITFDDTVVYFRYKIRKVFRDLVLYRYSVGLPYLDDYGTISKKTLDIIEEEQIPFIPVRTGFTCLSHDGGMCSKCYGLRSKEKHRKQVGENIGIAAVQSMCEMVSQMTMNVTHGGGVRKGNLVSGVDYFKTVLHGKSSQKMNSSSVEVYADCSGYVGYDKLNKNILILQDDEGKILSRIEGDSERWAIPSGAYAEQGEVIEHGVPNLQRYASRNIFFSSAKTRYLLLTVYNSLFSQNGLDIEPCNFEVLARAQTSQVYLVDPVDLPAMKDTSAEVCDTTGHYMLTVSSHYDIIHKFTGVGFLGFEDINKMLSMAVLFPEQNKLNSIVSNFFTGTAVGSTDVIFTPSYKKEKRKERELKQAFKSSIFDDIGQNSLFGDLLNPPNEPIGEPSESVAEEPPSEPMKEPSKPVAEEPPSKLNTLDF